MKRFTKAYLHSAFCIREFDAVWSQFQMLDKASCLSVLLPEIADEMKELPNETAFASEVAYWIGFTYRQLQIGTGIPSPNLEELLPFETMCALYPGLHTISEDMTFERLCESFHLEPHFREIESGNDFKEEERE